MLNVVHAGNELPVGFYARQIHGAEKSYSATELEVLAVISSIAHFAHYLYGRHVDVIIDHKALESLCTSKTLNKRLQRMAMKLQGWDVSIYYRPGEQNGNADALSRQEWASQINGNNLCLCSGEFFGLAGGDVEPSST